MSKSGTQGHRHTQADSRGRTRRRTDPLRHAPRPRPARRPPGPPDRFALVPAPARRSGASCSGRPGCGVLLAATLATPGWAAAQAYGMDEVAAQREAAGAIWSTLFLFAVLALAVHLILKSKALESLRDAAKGLAFLASAYLAAFFFLASMSAIARFLHFFGLDRDSASLIALPLGLVVAYRIYGAYEKWRVQKK